eukprot:3254555-Rhodomonas_salina.2
MLFPPSLFLSLSCSASFLPALLALSSSPLSCSLAPRSSATGRHCRASKCRQEHAVAPLPVLTANGIRRAMCDADEAFAATHSLCDLRD